MSKPFARAIAMMSLIATAMQSASPQLAMSQIGDYRSRGHGRGRYSGIKYGPSPSGKYLPHQGARECARRVRQMEAARHV